MSRSIRSMLCVTAAAVLFAAGCAHTVAGSALPDAAGLAGTGTAPGSQSAGPGGSTPGGSRAGTTAPGTSATQTPRPPTTAPGGRSSGSGAPSSSTGPRTSGPQTTGPQATAGTGAPYPTAPGQYYKNPRTQASANLLEARRIATRLLVPTLIDPRYNRGGDLSTLPLRGPSALSVLFAAPVPAVAQRAGMITGFSSARSDAAGNGMVVAAFEFPSGAQATAAVAPLAAASANKSTDRGAAVLAGLPAAAGWFGTAAGGKSYFQSFVAQGRMVLYVYLDGSSTDLSTPAQQAALAEKVLEKQMVYMPLLQPTPPADLMKLLVDPDSMLAHTLPNKDGDATVRDGIYTAAADLHFDSDPVGTKALFGQVGVDEVAHGRATLYRARDAAAALVLRDSFVASTQKAVAGMQPYTLTSSVPSARCIQQALNTTYYCVGTAGRYAWEVSASSQADINAAMSSQAAILKGF